MTTIEEGKQRLTFDASWRAIKFDDHPQHKKRAVCLQGVVEAGDDDKETVSTKAVDVVALRGDQLVLIEIKDFRLNPGDNRYRWLRAGMGLSVEVPAKARDTVATLIGAIRQTDCSDLRPMAKALVEEITPQVVLLLETGYAPDPNAKNPRERIYRKTMTDEMKAKLSFLGVKVLVLGQDNVTEMLPGLTVTNLPGATLAP